MKEVDYTPDPMDCPLCAADSQIVSTWIADLRAGRKSLMEVAAAFEVHPFVVQHHIKEHMVEPETTPASAAQDLTGIIKNARRMINSLNDWYLQIIDTNEVTSETVNMATKLAKSINDCLNTLAKIDGLITDDGRSTNYHELEADYNRLLELLTTEVCPECRQKLLEILEKS